jgi:hypothetical protein
MTVLFRLAISLWQPAGPEHGGFKGDHYVTSRLLNMAFMQVVQFRVPKVLGTGASTPVGVGAVFKWKWKEVN